jgi:murein DD-endopeptidase MepM/ murein hydrolase activator NlpD
MTSRTIGPATLLAVFALASSAAADTRVTVTPKVARPGDAVLVTVTGSKDKPKGDAGGAALKFVAAKGGFQAVFAIPLDAKPETLSIEIESAVMPAKVTVKAVTFPEADVIVEEEMANPPKAERDRIDADNKAILDTFSNAGEPQFSRPFLRPPGKVSSTFGEWRTFNDGHRSQHLGLDFAAKEGVKLAAINSGTVVLVREGFLTGNLVVVAHGGGISSAYYHLSKTTVAEGDKVERGAQIGLVGATGRTTGAHVHLSVRVPGGFVDPAAFLRLKLMPVVPKS